MTDKSKAILFAVLTILGYAVVIIGIIGLFGINAAWALFALFLLAIPSWFYRKAIIYAKKAESIHVSNFVKIYVPALTIIIIVAFFLLLPSIQEFANDLIR